MVWYRLFDELREFLFGGDLKERGFPFPVEIVNVFRGWFPFGWLRFLEG